MGSYFVKTDRTLANAGNVSNDISSYGAIISAR